MVLTKSQACGTAVVASMKLCIGIALTGLSFALYKSDHDTPNSERLYWVGIPMGIPGIVGIITAVTRSHVAMGFYLFCCICGCIVSAVGAVIVGMATLAVVALQQCEVRLDGCYCFFDGRWEVQKREMCEVSGDGETILITLTVLCCLSFILSLIGSIYGCIGTCCSKHETTQTVIVRNDTRYTPQSGQVFVTTMQSPVSDHYYTENDQTTLIA